MLNYGLVPEEEAFDADDCIKFDGDELMNIVTLPIQKPTTYGEMLVNGVFWLGRSTFVSAVRYGSGAVVAVAYVPRIAPVVGRYFAGSTFGGPNAVAATAMVTVASASVGIVGSGASKAAESVWDGASMLFYYMTSPKAPEKTAAKKPNTKGNKKPKPLQLTNG